MKTILQHIVNHKYLYTIVLFLLWMVFFDENKISKQYDLKARYLNLLHQKKYYLTEINQNYKLSTALEKDTLLLERIAREKYLMKRDNEVIYLIVNE